MDDGRLGRVEAKLDRVLRFIDRFERAFAPPRAPTKGEAKAAAQAMQALAGDMPPDEDMLEWSRPGPLPSEVKAQEREEADG
jgi:hypothetical protein